MHVLRQIALICHLRPFYAVHPAECDRQTCLCELHDNTQLAFSKLKSVNLIDSSDLEEIVKRVVCESKNSKCMYLECQECKDTVLLLSKQAVPDIYDTEMNWKAWKPERVEKTIKGEKKMINVASLKTIQEIEEDLAK